MDCVNEKFDIIYEQKIKELQELAKIKSGKKTKNVSDPNDLGYSVNKTLSKIATEQDRKLKSSKAYKTNQQKILDASFNT